MARRRIGTGAIVDRTRRAILCLLGSATAMAWAATGHAYPEFQKHIQTSSGQVVSCALCHTHPEGPDGSKHGQIGGLTAIERQSLAQSRAQFEPGATVNSPILNDFGDYLMTSLGGNRLQTLRSTPNLLASSINPHHDQDRDGIADARELRDGTDPTDPRHGHPARLLVINARRHWAELALATLATLLGLFGLHRLLSFFSATRHVGAPWLGQAPPVPHQERPALATRVPNH